MRSHRPVAAIAVAAVALGAAAAGVVAVRRHQQEQTRAAEQSAVRRFAQAWQSGRLGDVGFEPARAGSTGPGPADRAQQVTAGLTPAQRDAPSAVRVLGIRETRPAEAATGRLEVTWILTGGAEWSYRTEVPVVRRGERWLVVWSDQVLHPALAEGRVLRASRTLPPRAEILGTGGSVLVTDRRVVQIGIEPSRVKDLPTTVGAIEQLLGIDGAALRARVTKAKGSTFVDVITLRDEVYTPLRARLLPIPGVVFKQTRLPLAPTATFARALIGSVGQATKEIIDAAKGRVQAGDLAGTSGLQARYDEQLAGRAGITVSQVLPGSDAALPPVLNRAAEPGTPLRTTIDPVVQQAAEQALLVAARPSALVAVRPSTGEVLAVANGGPGAAGFNRAMLGQYPPGSTFKVASALALLTAGVTPETPLACPPTVTVAGKVFRNAEGEVLGTIPFRSAFAHSCNTAFVGSAGAVDAKALTEAGAALGLGRDDGLGLEPLGTAAFGGDVPVDDDPVQHAAQLIGQGKVLVSPLAVARMSAAVAAGRLLPARLVLRDGEQPVAGAPLPAAADAALRSMMREVVTAGTGTAVKALPGEPVSGKTGTAEFGGGTPPATHAWFTGYRGDLAFAVVVEGGGFGGRVAAPLAADFLRTVAAGS